jgi:hypothetical protein
MAIDIVHQIVGLSEEAALARLDEVGLTALVVERDGVDLIGSPPFLVRNRALLTLREGRVVSSKRG